MDEGNATRGRVFSGGNAGGVKPAITDVGVNGTLIKARRD